MTIHLGVRESWQCEKTALIKVWRGEASLATMLIWFPLFVLGSFAMALILSIGLRDLEVVSEGLGDFINLSSFTLAMGAAMAWSIGAMRATGHRLAQDQFVRAGILTTLAVAGGLIVTTQWVPAYGEVWSNFLEEYQATQKPKLRPAWTVTAVPELHRIVAQGMIGSGSARALEKVLEQHPTIRLVELDSHGGYIREGRWIEALIKKHGLDTVVLGVCESACTDIFLAGERRFAEPGAVFGFHQSGYRGRPRDTVWDFHEYETSIGYRQRNLPEDFIDKALNTSFYSMWNPPTIDLKKNGFVTDWWSNRPTEYR